MPKYYVHVRKTSSGKTVGFIPSKKIATKDKVRKEISKLKRKGLSFRILTEPQFKKLFLKQVVTRAKKRLRSKGKVVRRRKVSRRKRKR